MLRKGGWRKGAKLVGPPKEKLKQRALVIDGQALSLAIDPSCSHYLAELAMECTAVVCCRVSPDQKRAVGLGTWRAGCICMMDVDRSDEALAIGRWAVDGGR